MYSKEIEEKIKKEKCNKMIFVKEYYENNFKHIPEVTYYKVLERLVKRNELCHLSKGIYYIPKVSKVGLIPISDEEIVEHFIKSDRGIVVGYRLYNEKKITTQIGNHYDVYTTIIDEDSKVIGNVRLKKINFQPSENEYRIIEAFEILKQYGHIEDEKDYALVKYFKENKLIFNDNDLSNVIEKMKYKKSIIAFMQYMLNIVDVKNDLSKYLSNLSKYDFYKIKMECI